MLAGSHTVSQEHELALLLVGTRAARAGRVERIRELAARMDYDVLETLMREQGMLTLIGQRLREVANDALPDSFQRRLDEYEAAARQQGLYQQMLTIRLIAALEEEAIRVLPLKGPLLGERLYGDVGARVSADVDLLVGKEELAHAVEVLIGLGYEPHPYASGGARRPVLHERLVHASLPEVEMHWRVHWYEERFSADLLAKAAADGEGWLVAQPTDELVQLLLIYARDGFAGLRLPADLAAWWDRYGHELDSDGLVRVTERNRAIERTLATATQMAERLVGLPARSLLPGSVLSLASRRAMRLANWSLQGREGQISANVSLVDWALSPPGHLRDLVRRHLIISREDLLTRWPEARSSSARMLRARTLHALRVIGRYAIAFGFVFGRQAWAPLPESWEKPV
jgi:hypothetical protein